MSAQGAGTAQAPAIVLAWRPPVESGGGSVTGYEYRLMAVGDRTRSSWHYGDGTDDDPPRTVYELTFWTDVEWAAVPDGSDGGGSAADEQSVRITRLTGAGGAALENGKWNRLQIRARTDGTTAVSDELTWGWRHTPPGPRGGIQQVVGFAGPGPADPLDISGSRDRNGQAAYETLPAAQVTGREPVTLTRAHFGGGNFRELSVLNVPRPDAGWLILNGVVRNWWFDASPAEIDAGRLQFQAAPDFFGSGAYVLFSTADVNPGRRDTWRALPFEVENPDAVTPVCSRTPAVRDAIVNAVSGVSDCAAVRTSHLAAITALSEIETDRVAPGDFHGLGSVTELHITLTAPTITRIAPGTFRGLDRLEILSIWGDGKAGGITEIPAVVFDDLTNLKSIDFANHNDLSSLDDSLFQATANLERVTLYLLSSLANLPAGLLHNLTKLDIVWIQALKELTAIPSGFLRGQSRSH